MPRADLDQDLALMRDAVADAAMVALDIYNQGFESWKKAGHQPVTDVDMAVNAHLETRLRRPRPDYGWLSEETRDDKSRFACKRVWVVDPIDGTRALLKGRPHFVISVALIEDNRPVIGLLHNPVSEEQYEAVAGRGATLNGAPIHVSDCRRIEDARMIMYADFVTSKRWRVPFPQVETGMVNSIAYRLALVATGQFDGCMTIRHKNDWDLAAADLIIREAGGIATDREGQPFQFNSKDTRHQGVVAAGPSLHRLLIEKLKDLD